jgi:hypothetical protein
MAAAGKHTIPSPLTGEGEGGVKAYLAPLSPVKIPAIPADSGVKTTAVKPCTASRAQNSCGGGNSMMESLRY